MAKRPPILRPPPYVPAPRQVYAHLHGGFEVGCPRCGFLNVVENVRRRRFGHKIGAHGAGYDRSKGTLTCGGCTYVYYVGIILWPVGTRARLPEDHVPGIQELTQLRGIGAGDKAPKGKSGRVVVNGIGTVEGPEGEG